MCSFISKKFRLDSPGNIHFTKKLRELPGQPSYNTHIPSVHDFFVECIMLLFKLKKSVSK